MLTTAKDLDQAAERLKERASHLRRADELQAYLADIDDLEIGVASKAAIARKASDFNRSSDDCGRIHHDILPEPAQRVLRKYMRDALNAAILKLTAKADID